MKPYAESPQGLSLRHAWVSVDILIQVCSIATKPLITCTLRHANLIAISFSYYDYY